MEIAWGKVAPVIVSIIIIIFIAIIREYSKTIAAIAVTMPINLPLGIWLVYGSSTKAEMEQFTRTLVFNMLPTLVFVVIAWLAARAGWKLIPIIVAGYAGWGIGLVLQMFVRQMVGI
jgi:hypothetical protein